MSTVRLVTGNRNTDSWSMVAWLATRQTDLKVDEIPIDLRRADSQALVEKYSPFGHLPVLIADDIKIWDALSIIEFLAELVPSIWPGNPWQRAQARSVCCEARNGFPQIHHFLPMDLGSVYEKPGRLLTKVETELSRVRSLITAFRLECPNSGDFLFGQYCAADMMLAPIICSLSSYQVPMPVEVEDYSAAVFQHEDVRKWLDLAAIQTANTVAQGKIVGDLEDQTSHSQQLPPALDEKQIRQTTSADRPDQHGGHLQAPAMELQNAADQPASSEFIIANINADPPEAAGNIVDKKAGHRTDLSPNSHQKMAPAVKPIGGGIRRRR